MQQFTKRIFSFILLGVFLTYITPKEIFHAFTHHNDTKHEHATLIDKSGLQISNEHHHCELLKIDQQFNASNIALPFYDFAVKPFYYIDVHNSFIIDIVPNSWCNSISLRGPPLS